MTRLNNSNCHMTHTVAVAIAAMFAIFTLHCARMAECSPLGAAPNDNFDLTTGHDLPTSTSSLSSPDPLTRVIFSPSPDELEETETNSPDLTIQEKSVPQQVEGHSASYTCCKYTPPHANLTSCKLTPEDVYLHVKIVQMVEKERLNLIEYHLSFQNYSENPLKITGTHYHKPHIWSRASSRYGQTLLSLAFNYGIFSLMTLTFGTKELNVELIDSPSGCFGTLTVEDKIILIRELLMRDFDTEEATDNSKHGDGREALEKKEIHLSGDSRVCHEVIEDDFGYARFTDCCCYIDDFTNARTCEDSSKNEYLSFLYSILCLVRYVIFFFGPLIFLTTMVGLTRDEFPYIVKLNDTLVKNVVICKRDTIPSISCSKSELDFTNKRGFPKLKECLIQANDELAKNSEQKGSQDDMLPNSVFGNPLKVRIKEYDLLVNYRRLLTENDVSIGIWKTISNMLFFCKIRKVGPFRECCKQDMFKSCNLFKKREMKFPWIGFWRRVGSILLVLLIPTPYYIRLLVLYYFEIDEINSRKSQMEALGLSERFENSILHYFLPDHPIFITIYIVYAIIAIGFVIMSRQEEDGRIKQIVVGSFTDLKNLFWVDVLRLVVSNLIWPFKRFGILGCCVALVYWPIVVPLTLIVFIFYCLPTMFVTVRMLFYSKKAFHEIRIKRSKRFYRVNRKADKSLDNFDVEKILAKCCGNRYSPESMGGEGEDDFTATKARLMKQNSKVSDIDDIDDIDNLRPEPLKSRSTSMASTIIKLDESKKACRILEQIIVSIFCVLALYSILIIVTECLGSLIDMLVFTLMGIIVNAGNLLKYIALIIMIVVYSYDSFNNVEKKYLKLNKALFAEVKSRIKDLDKVTSRPASEQENHGFKAQEMSEQAEYELDDNISCKPARHWFINDLVLFVDNEDMPRIPKKLFEEVCEIRVAGVPGPVYQGLLLALKQFLKIVVFIVFVFMVVLTFGNVYQVSNTTQMLAALAGGSLPFILRTFMEPEKPDVEMGTVSFKSKLDEKIKNFNQIWPIYDFSFELFKPEDEKNNNESQDPGGKVKTPQGSLSAPPINTPPPVFTIASSRNFPLHYSNENIFNEYVDSVVTQEPLPNHTPVAQTKSNISAKVCFQEDEKSPQDKVDILIRVPDDFDEIFTTTGDTLLGGLTEESKA